MISYTSFSFFILYFGITFLLYSIMPPKIKWWALLAGSYVFYFISSKGHILPLIADTIIIWALGLWIDKLNESFKAKKKGLSKDERKALKEKINKQKSFVITIGVIGTLASLLICKYTNFFIDTTNGIFGTAFDNVKIVQPLGISFFTLQAISYMVDIKNKRIKAEKNPLRVSLYLSFMLTIVEGPIAKYGELGTQLNAGKQNVLEDLSKGFTRVLWGVFKKVVIADRTVILVSNVFDHHEKFGGISILIAIAFYTLQLYCEFSGVMDVMCGLGKMLGLNIPENFNRPFFSKTINEFWRRWHISLGAWLRDYIFYPISLSKAFNNLSKKTKEKFSAQYATVIPVSIALFFVWFANGFWHGAGWKYITYGLYYYVLMMIGTYLEPLFAKLCNKLKINRKSKGFSAFQIIRTTIIVNFGMLIFRADDLNVAIQMFKSIFDFSPKSGTLDFAIADLILVIVGFIILVAVGVIEEKGTNIIDKIYKLPYWAKVIFLLAFAYIIIIFGAYGEGYGVIDLIYANF